MQKKMGLVLFVQALVGAQGRTLGGEYFQEVAPGIAMDGAETRSMGEIVQVPAGNLTNCLKTK